MVICWIGYQVVVLDWNESNFIVCIENRVACYLTELSYMLLSRIEYYVVVLSRVGSKVNRLY